MRMKKRLQIQYAIVCLILIIVEVLIALLVKDRIIRPYVGDILVVVVLNYFIRVFVPIGIRLLPLYIFVFAVGIEVLQYLKFVELLGFERNHLLRTLIGSVFDLKDIICYAIGCLIIVGLGAMKKVVKSKNSQKLKNC